MAPSNFKPLLVILPVLLLLAPAFAQSTEMAADAPEKVNVGVYVLNIGKFDVTTGSFTVDFYLDMKCDGACPDQSFEFANGRADSIDTIIDDPDEKFYRIQASLFDDIDLRKYPFDRHVLTIELEDKLLTKEKMVYEFDEGNSGVDPSVSVVGWQFDGWGAGVADHYYAAYDETYSRFVFKIDISRVVMTAVLKSFLPVFFMVLIAMLSLILQSEKVTMRLSLNISTLLAAVMFHLNLTSQIPPVGYLTFADKFMIVTYAVMIGVLLSGILLMRNNERKNRRMEDDIYRYSLYVLPAAAVAAYSLIFMLQ